MVATHTLSDEQIDRLDPYSFMAVIGKKVIHPGGHRSTEELFRLAAIESHHRVLDVGCGVGTTAIEIARRYGCKVTAVDIDSIMLTRAEENVRAAQLTNQVTVKHGDILALDFADATFDRVIVEAVTMFVDRPRAVQQVLRVCRPGGRVLDHEFIYRQPPTTEIRRVWEGEVCPGIRFDTTKDWIDLYASARVSDIKTVTGPFAMMSPVGMVRDEGMVNLMAMMGRVLSRRVYLRKMSWLMPRILQAMPYLGYVVLEGSRPN